MTYGEIVRQIARKARISNDTARMVASYYWNTGVIRRGHGDMTLRDGAYMEPSLIRRALTEARREGVAK